MTKSVKVVPLRERLYRMTVWHPSNTSALDVHRWGPRLWLPAYDLFAIALGFYAFFIGSPLMNRLFPEAAVQGFGIALIISAVACLVGVLIPKLGLAELIGKLGLVFLLGAYAGTVAVLSKTDEPNGFVVIVLIMSVWLLLPRITVLFAQVAAIRAARKAAKSEIGVA